MNRKDYNGAIQQFEAARKVKPDDPKAANAIKQAEQRKNDKK